MLMEQLDYNLPLRWFVGVDLDDERLCHSTSGQGNLRLTPRGRQALWFYAKIKDKVEIGNSD
jgi:hypothetical protein